MKIELPDNRPYGALFAVGNRLSGSSVQEIGSIIVKASFLLQQGGGADTHVMKPDPDAAASKLVLSDEVAPIPNDGGGEYVTRETDTAPYKPLADIAVEGFRSGLDEKGAEILVDGALWLRRTEDFDLDGDVDPGEDAHLEPAGRADRNRHLFGYQPRIEQPRLGESGNPLKKPVPNPLKKKHFPLPLKLKKKLPPPAPPPKALLGDIVGYKNLALNFHRRGGGMTALTISDSLPPGRRIVVRKANADALSVTLTHPPLTALYRTYCGTGPDQPPYWTRIRLGVMRADTLILRPDLGRAEVVWRSIWPWADEPVDRYRAVRVSEGVI
jgi:hypothetical protein